MSANYILPDEPVPDFRLRMTRRGSARSINAPRTRKLAAKRIGVLAAAIAVPALATPDASPPMQAQTALVQPISVSAQQETLAGSAFAYLPDAPQLLAAAVSAVELTYDASFGANPGTNLSANYNVGPAARPMRVSGSANDYARAQQCMTQAIYYEAASESDSGQRAVAQVVLNRVSHPTYPNTVCGVVFQGSQRTTGCQFSFTCDGSLARRPSTASWARASSIARQALAGAVHAPVGLATHYHTHAVNPHWASSLDEIAVIGEHQFYRWRGRAGTTAAFTARYAGGEPLVTGRTMPATAAQSVLTNLATGEIAVPDYGAPIGNSLAAPVAGLVTGLVTGPNTAPVNNPAAGTQTASTTTAPNTAYTGRGLPTGGSIRSEYARSGAWRESPSAKQ